MNWSPLYEDVLVDEGITPRILSLALDLGQRSVLRFTPHPVVRAASVSLKRDWLGLGIHPEAVRLSQITGSHVVTLTGLVNLRNDLSEK